jgi:molecular chaperone GrpE
MTDEDNSKVEASNALHIVENLQKELAEAQAKAKENWEKVLRAHADMENQAKRARLDRENAVNFAQERFAKELLPVLDSLEQAKDIDQGVALIYKLLLDTMEKFHIKMLDPLGENFDPGKHEAVAMQPSNEVPVNSVLAVAQKGFILHERVLRPARVVVSKEAEQQV